MKNYTVTVRVRGGLWVGQRRGYDVQVEAADKSTACDLAMDMVSKEINGDFDSMKATARIPRK